MKIEIIAEIGVNHDGELGTAIELARRAAEAGADVIKTQLSVPERETSAFHAPEHLEMIRSLMLSREDLGRLRDFVVRDLEKEFLCTPAEEESLDWLVSNNIIGRIKIASDAVTDLRFLDKVAAKGLPVILSTGMSTQDEVADAFARLRRNLMRDEITLLHCTSLYPTAPHQVNLLAMAALRDFPCAIGWSDHTHSLTLPVAAAAMGAVVIEKHLTYDRAAPGPDHAASIEPHQFAAMVANIRELEQAWGDGVKRPHPDEEKMAKVVRKSVCAARAIPKGTLISYKNTVMLRPGTGVSPPRLNTLVNKPAERDYAEGEMIDG